MFVFYVPSPRGKAGPDRSANKPTQNFNSKHNCQLGLIEFAYDLEREREVHTLTMARASLLEIVKTFEITRALNRRAIHCFFCLANWTFTTTLSQAKARQGPQRAAE